MLARIRNRTEDDGFTLIELLVVMIIIGILAAIAIPIFLNQREAAHDSAIKSDLRSAATEIESFFVNNQAYPASDADLATSTEVDVQTSAGVTLAYVNAADGTYSIKGTSGDTPNDWWYCSAGGGLQPVGTTSC